MKSAHDLTIDCCSTETFDYYYYYTGRPKLSRKDYQGSKVDLLANALLAAISVNLPILPLHDYWIVATKMGRHLGTL